jgi:hypothetical protein
MIQNFTLFLIYIYKVHGDETYGLGELGGRGRKARGDEIAGKPVSESERREGWGYCGAGAYELEMKWKFCRIDTQPTILFYFFNNFQISIIFPFVKLKKLIKLGTSVDVSTMSC